MAQPKPFDEITLAEFRKYQQVQNSNRFNMLSQHAINLTGLDKATHLGIIEHYDALRAEWGDHDDWGMTYEEYNEENAFEELEDDDSEPED